MDRGDADNKASEVNRYCKIAAVQITPQHYHTEGISLKVLNRFILSENIHSFPFLKL